MSREVEVTRTGFAAVPYWVAEAIAEKERRGGSTLYVYTTLCMMAQYRTRVLVKGWETVCEETGLSRSTVMKSMRILKDVGAVARKNGALWLPLDPPEKSEMLDSGPVRKSEMLDSKVRDAGLAPLLSDVNSDKGSGEAPVEQVDYETAEAQELTILAFEQTPRPATPFPAVRQNILALLRAGHPKQHIADAIEQKTMAAWSINAMEIGVRQANHEPVNEWVNWKPSVEEYTLASFYDQYDQYGVWESDDDLQDYPPEQQLPLPRHPSGEGLYDAEGNRYRCDVNRRRTYF